MPSLLKKVIVDYLFLDIDLNDPEVEAAAAKIQSAFKNRKGFGKKNWKFLKTKFNFRIILMFDI